MNDLLGCDAVDPLSDGIRGALGQNHNTLRHREPGQADLVARPLVNSQHPRLGFITQQFGVGQRTGRYDAHDAALYWTFAGDLAQLFANGDGLPQFDQLGQVTIDGMEWHARHRDWFPC